MYIIYDFVSYPKGYHDVAITFLLVVGEVLGYHIMQRLSISHLKEFMAPTMDKTTYLLHYMYPLVNICLIVIGDSRRQMQIKVIMTHIGRSRSAVPRCTTFWSSARWGRYSRCRG